MPAQFPREDRFRISPTDHRGRMIDPTVVEAAEAIGQRAIQYADRILGDPAVAADVFDDAAATVSRVVRLKQRCQESILDLQAYLFRTFIRRVSKLKAHESRFIDRRHGDSNERSYGPEEFDSKILIAELLARCDPTVRDMFFQRIQGFSWKEIGNAHGVSAHAAESRYSKALHRVGKRLGLA